MVCLVLYTRVITNHERETMNTTTTRYQAVTIIRVAKGHYTVNNIAGNTITFARLSDAQKFINANWGKALIEAQFAA
jgi:hypothetical protein